MTRYNLKTYIDADAHLRGWFIFGEHANGTVDVSDGVSDVVQGVTRADAEQLIKARAEFIRAVCDALAVAP